MKYFEKFPDNLVRCLVDGEYKDGIFFSLIADGALYFKVDESNKKDYEDLGSEPFVYTAKGKSMTMSYWNLPEEIMNDREKLIEWIDKSVAVAINSKKNNQLFFVFAIIKYEITPKIKARIIFQYFLILLLLFLRELQTRLHMLPK